MSSGGPDRSKVVEDEMKKSYRVMKESRRNSTTTLNSVDKSISSEIRLQEAAFKKERAGLEKKHAQLQNAKRFTHVNQPKASGEETELTYINPHLGSPYQVTFEGEKVLEEYSKLKSMHGRRDIPSSNLDKSRVPADQPEFTLRPQLKQTSREFEDGTIVTGDSPFVSPIPAGVQRKMRRSSEAILARLTPPSSPAATRKLLTADAGSLQGGSTLSQRIRRNSISVGELRPSYKTPAHRSGTATAVPGDNDEMSCGDPDWPRAGGGRRRSSTLSDLPTIKPNLLTMKNHPQSPLVGRRRSGSGTAKGPITAS